MEVHVKGCRQQTLQEIGGYRNLLRRRWLLGLNSDIYIKENSPEVLSYDKQGKFLHKNWAVVR